MFFKRLSVTAGFALLYGLFALGAIAQTNSGSEVSGNEKSVLAPQAIIDVDPVNIRCKGESNGGFIINSVSSPSGTINGYRVEYSSGGTAISSTPITISSLPVNTLQSLPAGTYNVYIEYSNATDDFAESEIEEPANALVFGSDQITVNSPECNGDVGSVTANAVGGWASSYTYTLKDELNNTIPTGQYTSLDGGNYKISVIDDNNCSKGVVNFSITIPEILAPTVLPPTQIECYGGKGEIRITGLPDEGGYTATLNGNPAGGVQGATPATYTFTGLNAGTYDVEVVRNACSGAGNVFTQNNVIIDQYDDVTYSWATNPNLVSVQCYGGSETVTLNVNGAKSGVKFDVQLFKAGVGSTTYSDIELPYSCDFVVESGITYTIVITDVDGNCTPVNVPAFSISSPDKVKIIE